MLRHSGIRLARARQRVVDGPYRLPVLVQQTQVHAVYSDTLPVPFPVLC
jgi:hypothetical protein